MFNRQGRRPWACVNFITAHDGFTLNDIVTYNEKHNEANGEDNRTAVPTIDHGTVGWKGPLMIRISTPHENGRSATCWRHCCSHRARRCCWPAMSSAARRAVTTTRMPGQRDQLAQLGDRREEAVAHRLRSQADEAAAWSRHSPAQPVPARRVQRGSSVSRTSAG